MRRPYSLIHMVSSDEQERETAVAVTFTVSHYQQCFGRIANDATIGNEFPESDASLELPV